MSMKLEPWDNNPDYWQRQAIDLTDKYLQAMEEVELLHETASQLRIAAISGWVACALVLGVAAAIVEKLL